MSSQASQRHKMVMTAAVNRHFIMMLKLSPSRAHTHTHTVQGTNPCTGLGMCANVSLHSSSSLSQSFCYSLYLSIIKTWGLCHRRIFHVFFSPFLFFANFSHYQSLSALFNSFFLAFFLFIVKWQQNHWIFQIKTLAFCHLQPNSRCLWLHFILRIHLTESSDETNSACVC